MNMTTDTVPGCASEHAEASTTRAIAAAAMGTVFEWYEFTLYGALTAVIATNFFSELDPTTGFIFALLTFAVGFIMRPVGAVVFGRIGDRVGRKKTFLITILLMGISTIATGLLPTYSSIGIWAPILLITLRILQGLALGGEYGGAATYVAEHSASHRRGLNTAWISATGVIGLLTSFGMVLLCRSVAGEQFNDWGWRIPFLFSTVLLAISITIRLKMEESPAFTKMKAEKRLSKSPLKEAFTEPKNLKKLVIAFFGVCGGMTCSYYVALLYPSFFMTQSLKVDPQLATSTLTLAMLVNLPVFLFSGWLSDRIGRKTVLLIGFALSALLIMPIYKGISLYSNPDLVNAQESTPIVLVTDASQCSFMFNPTGTRQFTTPCDVAKQALAASGVSYETRYQAGVAVTTMQVGDKVTQSFNGAGMSSEEMASQTKQMRDSLRMSLDQAGFPSKADPTKFNQTKVFLLLAVLIFCGVFTLSPVATVLIEMFPARIRYTGMSFPYHLASGWVGGLLPTVAFAMSAQAGNIYFGLWYPITWAAISFVVALFFLKETRHVDINA